eukprot:8231187-Pyramimonas_sp.AAC.1
MTASLGVPQDPVHAPPSSEFLLQPHQAPSSSDFFEGVPVRLVRVPSPKDLSGATSTPLQSKWDIYSSVVKPPGSKRPDAKLHKKRSVFEKMFYILGHAMGDDPNFDDFGAAPDAPGDPPAPGHGAPGGAPPDDGGGDEDSGGDDDGEDDDPGPGGKDLSAKVVSKRSRHEDSI